LHVGGGKGISLVLEKNVQHVKKRPVGLRGAARCRGWMVAIKKGTFAFASSSASKKKRGKMNAAARRGEKKKAGDSLYRQGGPSSNEKISTRRRFQQREKKRNDPPFSEAAKKGGARSRPPATEAWRGQRFNRRGGEAPNLIWGRGKITAVTPMKNGLFAQCCKRFVSNILLVKEGGTRGEPSWPEREKETKNLCEKKNPTQPP